MSNVPVVVPVHPWPLTPERDALLRQAKASLDLDVLMRPVEAVPESPGRVLSFGGRPPFAHCYAPIRPENVDKVESIAGALRFCLTQPEGAPFDEAAWFSEVMGGEVRFLGVEEYEPKVAFR